MGATPASMTHLLDEALRYAATGFAVFPCNPDKHPATKHGFQDATKDDILIGMWFEQIPGAMIGLPTGQVNGIVVIDCDHEEGILNFEALCAAHGYEPDTLVASTPGSGRHVYFAAPQGIVVPCSTSSLTKCVDVRGDGGYVIAPPSEAPNGKRYEWLCQRPVAELPEWLLLLMGGRGLGEEKSLIAQAQ